MPKSLKMRKLVCPDCGKTEEVIYGEDADEFYTFKMNGAFHGYSVRCRLDHSKYYCGVVKKRREQNPNIYRGRKTEKALNDFSDDTPEQIKERRYWLGEAINILMSSGEDYKSPGCVRKAEASC